MSDVIEYFDRLIRRAKCYLFGHPSTTVTEYWIRNDDGGHDYGYACSRCHRCIYRRIARPRRRVLGHSTVAMA